MAEKASPRAQAAGAANFLMRDEAGSIIADNTDGRGLVTDMTVNAGWSLRDARILILGAGGAVRGVIPALLAEAPECIFLANRTPERAQQLADQWTSDAVPVTGGGFQAVPTAPWDLIINGTSTGLSNEMPALSGSTAFAPQCCAYDMAYGRAPTPFMAWASAQGVGKVLDGLGMLVEQAAESFFLWRGEHPDTTSVVSSLRAASRD
jgi:shikimate dehydrogenase